MNETQTNNPARGGSAVPDEIWGVNRPPALPPTPAGSGSFSSTGNHTGGQPGGRPQGHQGNHQGGPTGPTPLDRGFDTVRRSPLRRDSSTGVLGGVCAGIARSTGVSAVAIRALAVALVLFFGTGVAAYLIAWVLLPDERGQIPAERAVRGQHPSGQYAPRRRG